MSKVDRYVICPFQYFAESVLRLDQNPEAPGLTPLERGTLMHDLFERFYRAWDQAGTITPAKLPEAVAMFADMARKTCASLPDADRVLEETRLLGSLVARGVAERVFELEAEDGNEVASRHVEAVLRGPFRFPLLGGLDQKVIEINGKANRIDVFRDGSLRVVDYKLGRMPDLKTSIQSPPTPMQRSNSSKRPTTPPTRSPMPCISHLETKAARGTCGERRRCGNGR